MKTLVCTSCGHATSKDYARCPVCRKKALQYHDSFNTTSVHYEWLQRRGTVKGSNPMLSYMVVAFMATGLTFIMYSWMYPIH